MTRRINPPSNDNEPPQGRRSVNEIPENLPILEYELALVEAHNAAMIEELRRTAANDNRGRSEEEIEP